MGNLILDGTQTAGPATRTGFFSQRLNTVSVAALLAFVIFAFPMIPYLGKETDLWSHIEYARSIHHLSDIRSPHFLFQLLLVLATRISGASYNAAAIALMSLSYAVMAAVIANRMIDRRLTDARLGASPGAVVAASVLVLIASHIFLQTLLKKNFYFGYIAPIVYHSPTQVLSKALALVVMLCYFSVAFRGNGSWKVRAALAVGIVLSAVAKPSFLIAFLPCACAVELYRGATGAWKVALRNFALLAVPGCIVLAAQFKMTYGGDGGGAGLGIAPFVVYGGTTEVLSKLWGSLLFPVTAAVVVWRARAVSAELRFAWLLYVFGMAISVCLVESGPRMAHGNFAWTGQTVSFIIYVESAIALMALGWKQAWPAWLAFAFHVVFGVIWYSAGFVLERGTFW
jgi:hypothetical protein